MICSAHFYLLNDHFSIEYANEHNNGEESEMNRKHQWEDELEIKTSVTGIDVQEQGVYTLQGTMPSGEAFSHEIAGMRLFVVMDNENPVAQLACSESILDHYTVDTEDDVLTLKVYIKDNEPLSNPVPGIYIAAQEFPKELIF